MLYKNLKCITFFAIFLFSNINASYIDEAAIADFVEKHGNHDPASLNKQLKKLGKPVFGNLNFRKQSEIAFNDVEKKAIDVSLRSMFKDGLLQQIYNENISENAKKLKVAFHAVQRSQAGMPEAFVATINDQEQDWNKSKNNNKNLSSQSISPAIKDLKEELEILEIRSPEQYQQECINFWLKLDEIQQTALRSFEHNKKAKK